MNEIGLKGLIALVLLTIICWVAIKMNNGHVLWSVIIIPIIIGMLDPFKNENDEH